jgi:hypothetical protein
MRALPEPVRGGSVAELRCHLNLGDDAQFKLAVAWLTAAIAGRAPFPVLILHGVEGSAKSTVADVLRRLCDPNVSPLRAAPHDTGDLVIAANNAHIISLNNMSHMPSWLSDAICRLSTGSGFSTRRLWTDEDEAIFQARRPVLLNGIEELATQADLLDRSLILYLPAIPDRDRLEEEAFWNAFDAARPRILGALLDAVSTALRRAGEVKVDHLPRMADFAKFVSAAEPALGWEEGSFMAAYERNRADANSLALEASALARVIFALDLNKPWVGTATKLLAMLNKKAGKVTRRDKGWPTSPRGLTNALRRIASNLQHVGVGIVFDRDTTRERDRLIHLSRVDLGKQDSGPSDQSATPQRADSKTLPSGPNGRYGRNKA